MAKWNFTADSTSLIATLDDASGRVKRFVNCTASLGVNGIKIYEYGDYKSSFFFSQIGTIAGETPTDLEDAHAKISAIIPTSGGGSVSPASLISADADNAIGLGGDDKLFSPGAAGSVKIYKANLYGQDVTGTPITSGLLTIGQRYKVAQKAGDDFSNVGGEPDSGGDFNTYFTATGTTPLVWTNESVLTPKNPPVETILQDNTDSEPLKYHEVGRYIKKLVGVDPSKVYIPVPDNVDLSENFKAIRITNLGDDGEGNTTIRVQLCVMFGYGEEPLPSPTETDDWGGALYPFEFHIYP